MVGRRCETQTPLRSAPRALVAVQSPEIIIASQREEAARDELEVCLFARVEVWDNIGRLVGYFIPWDTFGGWEDWNDTVDDFRKDLYGEFVHAFSMERVDWRLSWLSSETNREPG